MDWRRKKSAMYSWSNIRTRTILSWSFPSADCGLRSNIVPSIYAIQNYCVWEKEDKSKLVSQNYGGLACLCWSRASSRTTRLLSEGLLKHLPFTTTGGMFDQRLCEVYDTQRISGTTIVTMNFSEYIVYISTVWHQCSHAVYFPKRLHQDVPSFQLFSTQPAVHNVCEKYMVVSCMIQSAILNLLII